MTFGEGPFGGRAERRPQVVRPEGEREPPFDHDRARTPILTCRGRLSGVALRSSSPEIVMPRDRHGWGSSWPEIVMAGLVPATHVGPGRRRSGQRRQRATRVAAAYTSSVPDFAAM